MKQPQHGLVVEQSFPRTGSHEEGTWGVMTPDLLLYNRIRTGDFLFTPQQNPEEIITDARCVHIHTGEPPGGVDVWC